jgi:hypothetical protein
MSEPFEITCFARWSRIVGTVRLRLTTRPTDLYTHRHPASRRGPGAGRYGDRCRVFYQVRNCSMKHLIAVLRSVRLSAGPCTEQ